MSAPDPLTVKVGVTKVALPGIAGEPMSASIHGGGRGPPVGPPGRPAFETGRTGRADPEELAPAAKLGPETARKPRMNRETRCARREDRVAARMTYLRLW